MSVFCSAGMGEEKRFPCIIMCTPSPFYSFSPSPDPAYQGGRDVKLASKLSGAKRGVPNFLHLFFSELSWFVCPSTAFDRIPHVIGLRSRHEMFGVNASRIVACVPYHKPFRDAPLGECVGKSMRADSDTVFAAASKNPIPTVRCSASPWPAFTRQAFIHFAPKAHGNVDFPNFSYALVTALRRAVFSCICSILRRAKGCTASRACNVYHEMESTHVFHN